ncbi:acyltransferase [Dyadobacter sp. LHD-138]|uniref:acyltransferase n=1 Tax=Dyadobacter sp. LHD-138 TaxID=3071413 RepID=UPI0027E06595|nr:acyltransferase [Dyadobacter sp. LHD-138]MDQ6481565.1 acyltransferase [Dyadobacter sp. LHD-138]
MIEKLIRKIKGNPDYRWENSYSLIDLLIITGERAIQLLRGLLFTKLFLKHSKGLLFVGKGVKIRHSGKITVGSNFIIGDFSVMNGLSKDGIIIGDNVSIGNNATLICTGVISHIGVGIKIGNGTGINSSAFLGGQGGISIGENVIIGPGVKIFSENHIFSDPAVPIKDQGVSRLGVVIKDNCWIGSNVTILDGVIIETGCIIAAGSVVTKSIPAMSIAGGIPAKIIKTRVL